MPVKPALWRVLFKCLALTVVMLVAGFNALVTYDSFLGSGWTRWAEHDALERRGVSVSALLTPCESDAIYRRREWTPQDRARCDNAR